VAISASGGIDFLFSNCGGVAPTDTIRAWVLCMKYPGSATVTVRGVSHASSSATVPFADAATNYAAGTLHGSAVGPTTLDNATTTGLSVVSYSGTTLELNADPGINAGEVIVANRGGTPCIGFVESSPATATFAMEFAMGAGTGIPTAADTASVGPHVEWEWVSVDVGNVSPSPWRGVRVTAGASGFPVNVVRVGFQKLVGGVPAPGLVTWPIGWGGHGYTEVINAMPILPDSDDGLTPLERFLHAIREPMDQPNSIKSAVVVPAQQGSTASSSGSFIEAFLGDGWLPREIAFVADVTNANNTSAFSTQAFQDFAAYGLTAGPQYGIVAICPFPTLGVPFSQLVNGWMADIAHKSTDGCREWGEQSIRILSPVADGGGGAALDTPAGGGFGSRSRPSRARPGR